MKKKLLALLLALVMVLSLGIPVLGEELSGKVTMWVFPLTEDISLYDPIVESFNKEYPNITIDIQMQPWNGRYEKMLTAIAGGEPPNLVYLNDFQVPLFAATNNLVNMSEVFTKEELEEFFKPGALKAVSYDGEVYGAPILLNSMTYLYNVDLFTAAGLDPDNPPETWEEIEKAAELMTKLDANGEAEQIGLRFDLNRPSPVGSILPFVWAAGGNVLDAEGKVIINSPEAAHALNYIKGLFEKGYIQKSNITGGGLPFSSGKVGIDLQREANDVRKMEAENPELNFKTGPILKDAEKIGYVSIGCFGIFKSASNLEATKAWIRHLTNKESTHRILSLSGFSSPRNDLSASEYLTDERLIYMDTQSQWATGTGPMNIHYSEILKILGSEFNSILLGIKTTEEGLKTAETQITSIMGQ